MAQPAKFLFDSDFGAKTETRQTMPLADHQALLAQAEAAGYRKGFAAAEGEMQAALQRRQAVALESIADGLARMRTDFDSVESRLQAEAAALAVAVGRKLAPALIAREPFAEIAALAEDCFRHLAAAPHLVVRVGETLLDLARSELDAIARRSGFEGRLIVLADPDLADGDCRIEWADGGITRQRDDTDAVIDTLLRRYIAARTGASAGATQPPSERTEP
ncbi:MAG TPA: FliH/SctL family protein [Xanthobacteraceae bacterium]|nr:FliH/SctL family protein [Xanthobacteraceae bacterium]